MSLLRHVARYLRPYAGAFVFAVIQVLLLAMLEVLKPWPLKLVIDYVLPRQSPPWQWLTGWSPAGLLALATIGLVVIYGVQGGLSVLNNFTTISIGQGMVNDLRSRLFQ